MSKIKPNRAFAKEIFSSFGGISCEGETSSKGATEMQNFRILPDGSIEKRWGWETAYELPDRIRGVWQGSIDGADYTFAVCGSEVYRVINDGDFRTVASLSTEEGRARFCFYRNRLYLCDEEQMYVLDRNYQSFAPVHGYAPQFGTNWHPTEFGSVNEPLNLFSNRLRIHYFNSTGTNVFILPFFPDSVEKVTVDGVTDTAYSVSGDRITVSKIGSSVEIAFTILLNSDHQTRLHQAQRLFVNRIGNREFMMLSSKIDGQYIYCSSQVDEVMLNGALRYYSDSDPLYFTGTEILTVGDAEHPVSRFCMDRNRVLAFHARGAESISLSEESNAVQSYPILHSVGCVAKEIDLYLDGDPLIANTTGIFRLENIASEPDHFQAIPLGEQMPFCRDEHFLQNMICCRNDKHGELWFRDATDVDGYVWVYNTANAQWYCFNGIYADYFVFLDGKLGFVQDDRICLFDESLGTDDGATFEAIYTSGYLCFSSPESVKRSLRISLCGWGCEATLELQSEKRTRSFILDEIPSEAPLVLDKRARFGRFRHLRVCLRDMGDKRSRFSRLALYSNL